MRYYTVLFTFLLVLTAGSLSSQSLAQEPIAAQADTLSPRLALPAPAADIALQTSDQKDDAISDERYDESVDDEGLDYDDEPFQEERVSIADPIEPFNRAMYQFNDKLYFWALKPMAQGYNFVVPEPARISAKNFFSNLAFPGRFINCLLQTDFSGAATEAGRFAINTVWGIGGLLDPAAGKELDLRKQDTDLGQTLGVYGVGHGFYIVWPVYGPSSPRDSLTIVSDHFLYPPSYLNPWYASLGVWAYEKVNAVSLRIGDYESLIGAAIDPYISMRDAYIQYRLKEIKARKDRSLLFKNTEPSPPAKATSRPE